MLDKECPLCLMGSPIETIGSGLYIKDKEGQIRILSLPESTLVRIKKALSQADAYKEQCYVDIKLLVEEDSTTFRPVIEKIKPKSYVCADCGHMQKSMMVPCWKCGGRRVVLISFVESLFGKDWREKCFGEQKNGK